MLAWENTLRHQIEKNSIAIPIKRFITPYLGTHIILPTKKDRKHHIFNVAAYKNKELTTRYTMAKFNRKHIKKENTWKRLVKINQAVFITPNSLLCCIHKSVRKWVWWSHVMKRKDRIGWKRKMAGLNKFPFFLLMKITT